MSSLRTITICTLALATTVVGCARTPAVTSMTAPAPGAAVGPAAPRSAAPGDDSERMTGREVEIDVGRERPQPSAFAPADGVKTVFFDFDRYEIRPGDARTLDADAAWLRAHDVLVLIEGQCDDRGTDDYNLAPVTGARRRPATTHRLLKDAPNAEAPDAIIRPGAHQL